MTHVLALALGLIAGTFAGAIAGAWLILASEGKEFVGQRNDPAGAPHADPAMRYRHAPRRTGPEQP